MAQPALNIELKNATKLFDQTQLRLGINVANVLTSDSATKIWMYVLEQYIQPQINARRPYERMWNQLYDAYRMRLKLQDMKIKEDETTLLDMLKERLKKQGNQDMVITDSLIFDTVDRLSNITHYISWKDGKPVQFGLPEDFNNALQDMWYSPTEDKFRSQNAVLAWGLHKEDAYTKSRLVFRDYYLYGFAYNFSDLYFQLAAGPQQVPILQDIGVSYSPMSVRKVFIDWRIPISQMNDQPCPFWFDIVPLFKMMRNIYHPALNPMGYVNLDKLYNAYHGSDNATYFMGGESWNEAIKLRLESMNSSLGIDSAKYCKMKALWTFMPMLPFDATTGDWMTRKDGTPVPFRRFILQIWGDDLMSQKVTMVRLQDVEDHYEGQLPIYGATHLDDLSSAAYSMSICEVLINSAIEITQTMNYALENKNKINNPPSVHLTGSPSMNQDVNAPNAKVEVLGQGDFEWRQVPDATQTTMAIANGVRDKAQATGRVTESILGKALGGRTTALEAGNLFETSMSQITTDINILNAAYHGGYAGRMYSAYTKWLDPNVIKLISGSFGWPEGAIDRTLRTFLRTDVGNRYITSQLKQQRIQFMLQAAVQSPVLDQAVLWSLFAKEVGMPSLQKAIIDNGRDREIERAKDQCFRTYLNEPIVIDPGQDHTIAMQVKTRFVEDTKSEWNVKYGSLPYLMTNVPRLMALAQQVQIHQNYLLQQQQMAAALQMQRAISVATEQGAMATAQQQQQQQRQLQG